MAIIQPSFYSGMLTPQNSLPFDRARAQEPLPELPQNAGSGSLVIIDGFQDTYSGAAHGNIGAYAARQHGFTGNIYAEQVGGDTGRTSSLSSATFDTLGRAPLSANTTRTLVESFMRNDQTELLQDLTGDLNKIRERGLKDSAVNISYGTNAQRQAMEVYSRVRSAPPSISSMNMPQSLQNQYRFSQNVLRAYGIDSERFYSSDVKVSGPERTRLQEQLIQAGVNATSSKEVVSARGEYSAAVKALEAQNNSVVVSAGNNEGVLQSFRNDAGGVMPKAPLSSKYNITLDDNVTTVGATRWRNGNSEYLADYSNRDPQVDIYASGSVGNGLDENKKKTMGTSFAAPRVAAAMAAIHKNYPGMPSKAVENMMLNSLTHELDGQRVLDFSMTEQYMRNGGVLR